MFTRERHRRGVVYFGPYANAKKVRETLDVLNRVFQYRPCEGPKPGRHSGIPCLDYHIERCKAPCVGYIYEGGLPGDHRPRDRVPLRRDAADPARARAADAGGGRGGAVRGRRALPQPAVRDPAPRGAAGGGPALGRHRRRDRLRRRGRPRRGADLPAPRRQDRRPLRLPPRERRGPRPRPPCSRRSASSTTARRRASRRSSSSRRTRATPRRSSSSSPTAAARGSRCARRRAARSGGCRSSPTRTRASRSSPTLLQSEQRRLRRVEALEELREALNLESLPLRIECYDISNIQAESPVGSMVVFQDAVAEEGALPEVRRPPARRAGRLRGDGGGRLAALRAAARRDRRRVRRVLRGDAEPRRDRRRQGPALGGAGGDAGVRSAARRRHRPRQEEEEVFVPGRAGSDRAPAATRRACSCSSGSATRRTASRSASTGSVATRKARGSIFDEPPGVGPARRRALLRHFGSAERLLEATPGGARGRPGRAREDGARRSTRSCTRPAGPSIGACGDSSGSCARVLALAACGGGGDKAQPTTIASASAPGRSGQGRGRDGPCSGSRREDRRALGDALDRSKQRLGPTLRMFERRAGGELVRSLGSLRDPKVIVSERITPEFGVVAVDGRRNGEARRRRRSAQARGHEVETRARRPGHGPADRAAPGKHEPVVAQVAAAVIGPGGAAPPSCTSTVTTENPKVGGHVEQRNAVRELRAAARPGPPHGRRLRERRGRRRRDGLGFHGGAEGFGLERLRQHEHEDREPPGGDGEKRMPRE